MQPTPSKVHRWSKALLLVFCCWHAVFLLISITPGPPGWSESGRSAVSFYRLIVVGQQQWTMFAILPTQHSVKVRLEGEPENGSEIITAGCVLPGFKPYPEPERSRYYVLISQLLFMSDSTYRDAYLHSAARQLQAAGKIQPGVKWSLVADAEYTRHLVHLRRGGPVAVPVRTIFDLPEADVVSP